MRHSNPTQRPRRKKQAIPAVSDRVVTIERADLHDEIAAALEERLGHLERRLIGWMVVTVAVAVILWLPVVLWLFLA